MRRFIALCFIIFVEVICQDDSFRFDYTYYPDLGGSIKLHLVPDTWANASYRCEIEGTMLAWPRNKKLLDKMLSILKTHKISRTFIGVHSLFSKGDFTSIDGIPLARMTIKWLAGEPDNADYSEECLILTKEGYFADVKCTNHYAYLCYLEHDRILTKNRCGTVDDAYTFNERTNSCYKFHSRGQSWNTAYKTCYAEGGHLVVIDSHAELDIVKQTLQAGVDKKDFRDYYNYKNQSFAGIYNWKDLGWHTLYGDTELVPEYTACKKFLEPLGPGDTCASVSSTSGDFSNTPCSNKLPYICKKTPDSLYVNAKSIF